MSACACRAAASASTIHSAWPPALTRTAALRRCWARSASVTSRSARFPAIRRTAIPRPRLFRLPEDDAIVVSYGVPNDGAEAISRRLNGGPARPARLGVNLVKTNDPARPAVEPDVYEDYARSFELLQDRADYIALNMSCPNSPGDRDFFDQLPRFDGLLGRLAEQSPRVPVFLKLKPTRDEGVLREIVAIADAYPFVAGFSINLPAGKPADLRLSASPERLEGMPGAVGGRPVEELINDILARLYGIIGPDSRYGLMAAGGVFTAADALRKIRLGASVVQVYSGLVYRGPSDGAGDLGRDGRAAGARGLRRHGRRCRRGRASVIHRAARIGFSRSADAYERARPGYPAEAVEYVVVAASRRRPRAGSRRRHGQAHAPADGRRPGRGGGGACGRDARRAAGLRRVPRGHGPGHPGRRRLRGRGHGRGQAFHWFAEAAALREIHRVLRPGAPCPGVEPAGRRTIPSTGASTSCSRPTGTPRQPIASTAWRSAFEAGRVVRPARGAGVRQRAGARRRRLRGAPRLDQLHRRARRGRAFAGARAGARARWRAATAVVSYRCEVQTCRAR